MPFKGDSRLGGPHDNEVSLNGTADEDNSVPPYGTFVSGPFTRSLSITIQQATPPEVVSSGLENYSNYADGVGGTYEVVNYTQYPQAGTRLGSSQWDARIQYSTYVNDGTELQFPNGKTIVKWALADGYGSYWEEDVTIGSYFPANTPVVNAPFSTVSYQTYTIEGYGTYDTGIAYGNTLIWGEMEGQPNGVISMSTSAEFVTGQHYPDGTFIVDAPDSSVEVPSGSGNYYFDGNDNRWEWDGNGVGVFRYSGLYPDGTFITNYDGTDYYWDGSGGYRT